MAKNKESKFDRVVSGAKKAGEWAISEDNVIGRGSKRVSEMAEEKATQLNKEQKPIRANALRTADAVRDTLTPKSLLDIVTTVAGIKAVKGAQNVKLALKAEREAAKRTAVAAWNKDVAEQAAETGSKVMRSSNPKRMTELVKGDKGLQWKDKFRTQDVESKVKGAKTTSEKLTSRGKQVGEPIKKLKVEPPTKEAVKRAEWNAKAKNFKGKGTEERNEKAKYIKGLRKSSKNGSTNPDDFGWKGMNKKK